MLAPTLRAIDRLDLGQDGDQSCISSNGSVGGTLDARCSHHGRRYPNKETADHWSCPAKEVGDHIEHIYMKIGCSSRAEASLFPMQRGPLGGLPAAQR